MQVYNLRSSATPKVFYSYKFMGVGLLLAVYSSYNVVIGVHLVIYYPNYF